MVIYVENRLRERETPNLMRAGIIVINVVRVCENDSEAVIKLNKII